MVAQIVTYVHLFYFAVFIFAFNKNIFEEIVIMLLHFFVADICNHWEKKQFVVNAKKREEK